MAVLGIKKSGINWVIVAALFFIYLFVVYDTKFYGPDEPIYFAYTASIVEDGDLNAINHLDPHNSYYFPSGRKAVSKTYNLPDFHNHGGVVLWAPFYAYAKLAYSVADKLHLRGLTSYGYDRLTKCAMSFSTVIFGFFVLILTYWLCRIFFSKACSIWSVLVLFIGTPFFYFMTREVGNANIVASLFSVISIWVCVYAANMRRVHWLLYGLFFSICIVVKLDLLFQLSFILILFIMFAISKKIEWLSGAYFLAGVIPVAILKTINDYIKYGSFRVGEVHLLNFNGNYLFEQLFSSYRGFFYTSPILYLCLLGFILAGINLIKGAMINSGNINKQQKMNDIFFIILSSYIFIKILLLGYRYAWGGGTCGARLLLTELPVFVLLYARVLQQQRKRMAYIIVTISVLLIFWNLLIIAEYISKVDLSYIVKAPGLLTRICVAKNVLLSLFYPKDLMLKLKLLFSLLVILSVMSIWITRRWEIWVDVSFRHIKNQEGLNFPKFFGIFTAYLCIIYIFFTLLNVYNSGKKVERLKGQGFFANSEVISPGNFEKEENVGSMKEMIEYYRLKGDVDKAGRIREQIKRLYGDNG